MKKKIMWKKVLGLSLAFAMCAGIGVGMMDTGRITASADEYKRTLVYTFMVLMPRIPILKTMFISALWAKDPTLIP